MPCSQDPRAPFQCVRLLPHRIAVHQVGIQITKEHSYSRGLTHLTKHAGCTQHQGMFNAQCELGHSVDAYHLDAILRAGAGRPASESHREQTQPDRWAFLSIVCRSPWPALAARCYRCVVRTLWSTVALILVLPLLVAWPLPVHWADRWLAMPSGEAVIHVWGLWATSAAKSLFNIETFAAAWPDGIQAVLADPVNLPWFLLGWPLGVAGSYNTVLYGNLVLLGIAGAALARHVGGAAWLGVVVAVTNASVLAAATAGITEQFGIGWLGLFVVALLQALRHRCLKAAAGAGVLLALTAAAGPYNGIWAAMLAVGIGVAHLIRSDRLRHLAPLGVTAAVAGMLVAPLAKAVLTGRVAGQPGTSQMARQIFSVPANNPDLFRGGVRFGSDLTDPFFPLWLTGGAGLPNHTAYIGTFALLMALVVVAKRRALWPWLVAALAFSVLSLGPWLIWWGVPLAVGGQPLLAPAGMLADHIPFLGRISHWHRAGAVAALLLVPLVSLVGTLKLPKWAPVVAALLVLADRAVGSPVPWPLPAYVGPDMSVYEALEDSRGAVFVMPTRFPDQLPPRARWRDPALIAQLSHGHPISEAAAMGNKRSTSAQHIGGLLTQMGQTGRIDRGHRATFFRSDFVWLAVYKRHMRDDTQRDRRWAMCFGEVVGSNADVDLYKINDGVNEKCLSGGSHGGKPAVSETR